jgi:hypothetical protein
MRIHYLISLAAVSIGVLTLFYYPFDQSIATIWLPLTALSYFIFYARDLSLIGYRWTDMMRVYALNLVLIPVILEGVMKSIQQMWSGRKTPFGRTPKVTDRTSAPALSMACELAILCGCFLTFSIDAVDGRYWHALFSLLNGALFGYAIYEFIGFKEALTDLRAGLPENLKNAVFARLIPIEQDRARSLDNASLDVRHIETVLEKSIREPGFHQSFEELLPEYVAAGMTPMDGDTLENTQTGTDP